MFRKFLIICLLFVSSQFSQINVAEAAPEQVQVKVNRDVDTGKFIVTLSWKYTNGESLAVSEDGATWQNISLGNPVSGSNITIVDQIKRDSHSIIYYEVQDGSGKKRVNVFPGTGDNYANQHGNYDNNTNTCVNCHTTHKSEGSLLLKENTIGALCDTCHSASVSGGVGSRYMTDAGSVASADNKDVQALAGLFGKPSVKPGQHTISTKINDVWKDYKVGSETLHNATSIHTMESTDLVAPGDTSSPKRNMNCASCHQGHPKDNNYRLLRSTINGTNIGEIEAYAVSDGKVKKDSQMDMELLEKGRYVKGLNEFCAQCHNAFNVKTGSATNNPKSIGGKNHYLHPVGEDLTYIPKNEGTSVTLTTKLPVGSGASHNQILCITCHFAHGTPVADKSIQTSNYRENHSSSMLKRKANQAICQDCHKK